MSYRLLILLEAQEDISHIYRYILLNDSANAADRVSAQIEERCDRLRENPERGHAPPELERVGVTVYREIHLKPYRIIYEIEGRKLYIHSVLDGRRDLLQLLERRLLR